MCRKTSNSHLHLAAAMLVALGASNAALADDNSMSVLTGDSYAFFNGLEYRAGHFNVPRLQRASPTTGMAATPGKEPAKVENADDRRKAGDKPILLADRPLHITLPSPFSDDKGA